ncbi:MAG: SDR family oxidoreductase [Chloroflexi bacterium]|jgi:3-oxoacyl-[acyl-carrier protein] reductase|nr:SDR family oxidoreductase [Chloroflexota bacterium]
MADRLQNKVALITGSGSKYGIGRAAAILFALEGAKVVVADINEEASKSVVKEIRDAGGTAIQIPTDVTQVSQVKRMVNGTVRTFGRIDILANTAANYRDMSIVKMQEKDFHEIIDVCLNGTFYCTKYAVAHMINIAKSEANEGKPVTCRKIIHFTSGAGLRGNPGQANYSAAKAGIIGLTKSNAKEFARYNITVNAISPFALTPLTDLMPNDLKETFGHRVPLGRWGDPEKDIAPVALFLASKDSNYITGQVIIASGGLDI